MWIIDLENAPPRLRGFLSRWGVEVRAGLYVGSASFRMREELWKLVCDLCDPTTSVVMIVDSRGPQGFVVATYGPNRREIVDLDGMYLARYVPTISEEKPISEQSSTEVHPPWDIDPGFLEP